MVSVCGHLSPCFQTNSMYKTKDQKHNEQFLHKFMDLKPQSMVDGTVGDYRTFKIQSLARENTSQRADLGDLYHYLILACILSASYVQLEYALSASSSSIQWGRGNTEDKKEMKRKNPVPYEENAHKQNCFQNFSQAVHYREGYGTAMLLTSQGTEQRKAWALEKMYIIKSTVLVTCPPITLHPPIPNQYELISGLMNDINTLMMSHLILTVLGFLLV